MRDPKAIRKAIMTAKSVATLIDPHFGRVPMPELGEFGRDKPVEEHSPLIHAAYDVPMPEHFAAGGTPDDDRQGNLSAFLEGNHPLVPDVVYHGTDRDISEFDTEQPRRVDYGGGTNEYNTDTGWYGKGHYFTPHKRAANDFASDYNIGEGNGPNVMPVHLSLKNPFIVKVPYHSSGAADMDRTMDAAKFPKTSDQRLKNKGRGERLPSEQTKMLMDAGHDGVLVLHQYGIKDPDEERAAEARKRDAWQRVMSAQNAMADLPRGDEDAYEAAMQEYKDAYHEYQEAQEEFGGKYHPHELVVFKPHQIKSAIGNSGQYNPHEADITKSYGGDVEGRKGYDDGGGVLDTLGNLANQYVVQPAKDAASAVNRNVVQPVAKAFDENIAQPVANAFAPPPPPKPKVTVSLVGANSSFPEGTAPGYLDKRFHEIPFRAYRADAKNQFGGGEGIETLPIPSWKNNPGALYSLYNYARAAGAAQRYGYPTIDPRTLAAMGLKEGRSDYGFNGFKPQATPDTRFYQTLSENYNLSPDISEWLGMINYADRVSKKRNIPFTMVWNGTGTNAYGQTGAQYANSMQAYLDAVNHPKNKDYYRFIENAYKEGQRYGFAPKRKAKKAGGGEVDDGRDLNDFGLYSHAAEQAGTLARQDSPENYLDMLMKRGVKPAEIKWSGYDEAFADQPQISRDQLVEHFNKKMPDLYETQFGGEYDDAADALQERHAQEMRDRARELGLARLHGREHQGETLEEIQLRHQQERSELRRNSNNSRAFHEDYTLPGGKNYREVLVQHNSFGGFKGVQGHFGQEPDIITSLRLKDRQDHEGAKVLHLEELQSDWGQKARKHGFRDDQRLMEASLRYNNAHQAREEAIKSEDAYKIMEADKAREEAYREYRNAQQAVNEAAYIGKTDDWVDLGLKRALWEAAKGGYDKLAWSPGEVQADRYDLSRHIKEIHHENNDDGTYNLIAYGHDGEKVYDKDDLPEENLEELLGKEMAQKVVSGEGKSGKEEYDRHLTAKEAHDQFAEKVAELYANDELSREEFANHSDEDKEKFRNVIKKTVKRGFALGQGPKIAEEIGLSDEYLPIYNEFTESKEKMSEAPSYSPYRDWRVLSGLDLKVGGEGMHKFYNEMLPKRLKKLAKQHDPEAGFVNSIVSHTSTHDPYENDPNWEPGDTNRDTNLPAIEITPKMRESILKRGFPAYAEGGEVDGHTVGNPMSIFPKPQRMWEEDMPGGAYLSMPDQEDVTGHKASSASIGIQEGGKPYFHASRDPAEVTGSPGRGSATVKTNLFKQKAGWKWLEAPEGHQGTNTLVSVEHRGKHHYVLHAHFPKGVDLARYPDAPSEPRLRPTTKGNVELGPQVGSISVRGKEHPVYAHAIVKSHGGEVEGFARGGTKSKAPKKPSNPNAPQIPEHTWNHLSHLLHSLEVGRGAPLPPDPAQFKKYLQQAQMALASPITIKGSSVVARNPGAKNLKMGKFSKDISDMSSTVRDKGTLMPYEEADLEKMQREGASIAPFLGDLSAAGRYLTHVGPVELVEPSEQQGGAEFMRSEFAKGIDPAAYGNRTTAARTLARKIAEQAEKGRPIIGTHVAMGVGSIDSSHHAYQPIIRMIPNMDIKDEHIAEFDDLVRKTFPPSKRFPMEWPGILNTRKAEQFFANRPGTHASTFVDLLDRSKWQKAGFPDVGEVRFAASDPRLLGHPRLSTGAAFSEVEPTQDVVEKPVDLFHTTYPTLIKAKKGKGYRGGASIPIPARLMFPDFYKTLKSVDRSGNPIDYDSPTGITNAQQTIMTQVPVQKATQEWLDNIMEDRRQKEERGFRKGGSVRKALMIAKSVKKK